MDGSVSAGGAASNEMSKPSRRADGSTESRTSKSQMLAMETSVENY